MLKSVFLFLEFLTIMGKELGESVRENHAGFPAAARTARTPALAGGAGIRRGCACSHLLSAAPLHGEQAWKSHHLHFLLESH